MHKLIPKKMPGFFSAVKALPQPRPMANGALQISPWLQVVPADHNGHESKHQKWLQGVPNEHGKSLAFMFEKNVPKFFLGKNLPKF